MRAVFIIAILLVAFFWGYSDMVGDPFSCSQLDFGRYYSEVADLMGNSSKLPFPKIFFVIVAYAFPRLIKLLFSDSPDRRSHQDEKPAEL